MCDLSSTLHVEMPYDMDLETMSRVSIVLYNLTIYEGNDYPAASQKGSHPHIRSTLLQECGNPMKVVDADLRLAFVLGDTTETIKLTYEILCFLAVRPHITFESSTWSFMIHRPQEIS